MTQEVAEKNDVGDFGIFAMANTSQNITEIAEIDLPEEYAFFAPEYILICMPGNGKEAPTASVKITSDELAHFGMEAVKWAVDCGTDMMISSAKAMEEEDASMIRKILDEIEQELLRTITEAPDKGGEPNKDAKFADNRRNKKYITARQRR